MKAAFCSLIFAASFVLGCYEPKSCWEPASQAVGYANPSQGSYTVVWAGNPNADGGFGNPVYPLTKHGLYVGVNSNSEYVVSVTTDGYRIDVFPLWFDSTFAYIHGGGADGTVCPTDGYVISGRIFSATQVTGHFKDMSSCGCGGNEGDFIATLKQ
jgi:hypothetical protein